MRKPRRLTPEQLAPYQWQMPRTRTRESGLRTQTADDVDIAFERIRGAS